MGRVLSFYSGGANKNGVEQGGIRFPNMEFTKKKDFSNKNILFFLIFSVLYMS